MNILRHEMEIVEQFTKRLMAMPYEEIRQIINYLKESERQDYENTPVESRLGHIFRAIHTLDCWISELEFDDCKSWHYPIELKSLGSVTVQPEVLKFVSKKQLDRLLDDHRMCPWGTQPDPGENNEATREFLKDHNGFLESFPEVGKAVLSIHTELRTETVVSVYEVVPPDEERLTEEDNPF